MSVMWRKFTMTRPNEKIERNEAIAKQRRAGRTLQEIGDKFGVTRERVRQICDKLGAKPPKVEYHIDVRDCPICGKIFTVEALSAAAGRGRKTCSVECQNESISQKNRSPDKPTSRHGFVDLMCAYCGKEFKRSKYRHQGNRYANCEHDFCDRTCYFDWVRNGRKPKDD